MPRRILLLITDLQIGGTPTVVRELAIRLREPGRVEVEVACLSAWGPVADQLRAAGVRVTAFGGSGAIHLPIVLWKLIRLIRTGGFDTVFSYLIHANAVAAAASLFCSDVRFLQSIQTTQPYPKWHWRLQRVIHPLAEAVVVPSQSTATAAEAWANVPPGRVVVIPNAVDVATFDALYNNRREPAQPFQIGFIGRLDPIKRIPDLLEAAKGVSPEAWQLQIFGEGAERPHLQEQITRLGLQDVAFLRGAVATPQEALSQLDVLVLPSDAEGFGLVLIEAMAAGVPVVGTNVPGIRNVIRDVETGVLIPPRHPPAITGAATMLCINHYARERLTRAARSDVERRFSWPAVLSQYRRVLGIHQPRQGRQPVAHGASRGNRQSKKI